MDSSETRNDVMALNSSDSAPVQVTQKMPGVPRYDESQQYAVEKNCMPWSHSHAASISGSFSSRTQVLELSSAGPKPILSTSHAPKFGRSGGAVFRPSGIGLHLNSLVALPPSCAKTLESTENAVNSQTSSKAVDGLLNPSEKNSTACHQWECAKLSPPKRRKMSTSSSDGDGCKNCSCKKTKCLKLYCECFASGHYCAETCSCQGCLNIPEYEDKVLATRTQVVSRDPFAFAPKIMQPGGEAPANDIQEIPKSTPSSAKHKRGCTCKKSMCLKRYCECYQSKVGCSDGCRCAECKNTYGKKEGKHIAITEATIDMPEKSFDQDTILHSEPIPQNMTNDMSGQPCPGSGSFSLIPSVVPSGENQPDMLIDDIFEDLDLSAILGEDLDISALLEEDLDISALLEARSPENKRVSPPHSSIPELRPSSSMTRLEPGRKHILKAVPSIPSCPDPKSNSSPNTNA